MRTFFASMVYWDTFVLHGTMALMLATVIVILPLVLARILFRDTPRAARPVKSRMCVPPMMWRYTDITNPRTSPS